MKKILLVYFLLYATITVKADEGIWLPLLLDQLNMEDMRNNGFKLTAEDIYSVNSGSMKDAVVLFGGGCSGTVVSNEGLLITNHHCGFSTVSALSTIDNNYLKDGYWSKNKSEEFPCPGLTVTFIVAMFDVTDSIIPYLSDEMAEADRNATIRFLSAKLEANYKNNSHYDAAVKAFYYGNEFYLFLTETFKDIRLVGVPPESIGNFGGETDNWVWPRHTGDFSMFRIYAGADNAPASYDISNKPFIPRHYFSISIKGVVENDFTMVYGFPGRTQEYLPAAAVDLTINSTDLNRVFVRDKRIAIMRKYMEGNDTITLMYAAKTRSLMNADKKWKGEMKGLELNNAVGLKLAYEDRFQAWTNTQEGASYKNLLAEINKVYNEYEPYSKVNDYTSEGIFGIEIINFAGGFKKLIQMCFSDTVNDAMLQAEATKLKLNAAAFFKKYELPLDKEMFKELMQVYIDSLPENMLPPYIKNQYANYPTIADWRDVVFAKSKFSNLNDINTVLTNFTQKKGRKLSEDPAYQIYANTSSEYETLMNEHVIPLNVRISQLMRYYMKAQMLFESDSLFYPDGNLTLRLAYGKVEGYIPRDGVEYEFTTHATGILEKYIPGDVDFDAPQSFIDLLHAGNFSTYADKTGDLPIAFIATNHTTGGNSGSPVINGNGELIGINYDRVWEGTMSDILFDPTRCRNISLDIRYMLFIIDKYAGAENIMQELHILE